MILALLAWWLRRIPDAPADLFQPCIFRAVSGVPCPTCGSTRALVALAHGQPTTALAVNPLMTLATLAFVLWALGGAVVTVVPRWRRRIEAPPGLGRRLMLAALVLVIGNWAWLLARGC